MTVEQALQELKKYVQELVAVGNVKEYIQINREDFIHRWSKVNQYYNYLINKVKNDSDEWWDIIDIMSDIPIDNPSLEEWVLLIMNSSKRQKNKANLSNVATSGEYEAEEISHQITSYVSEIKNMASLDSDYVDDMEWILQKLKEKLISHRSNFDNNTYYSLLDDLEWSLKRVGNYNTMMNSEKMESLMRM